ncbi:MAG TPA: hypothetical protein VGJ09_20670, partial [Bryobacteraceae bacterium]
MKLLRLALVALAAAMGLIVAARMLAGPFTFSLISVITPLNPEGFFGLAVILLLAACTVACIATPGPEGAPWTRRKTVFLALAVAAITIWAFRRALGIFFLSDDFVIVTIGNTWNLAAFRYALTHGGGDGFFRPLGIVAL